ncbi:MAG: hypothetical protein M0Z40_06560 [Actinomycetota bacterium]|nr:hypothetical protein [Actinomycetota bacterium]
MRSTRRLLVLPCSHQGALRSGEGVAEVEDVLLGVEDQLGDPKRCR